MSKTSLIIRREYWTRIRKKSFIIVTLLGPLIFASTIIIPIWLATRDSGEERAVAVIDESGLFADAFRPNDEDGSLRYEYITIPLNEAKADFPKSNRDGLLYIPRSLTLDNPEGITYYAEGSPSLTVESSIERHLREEVRNLKIKRANISQETLDALDTSVDMDIINLAAGGEGQQGSSVVASGVGYISSLLIYFFVLFYGTQVMRGVVEEKSSRIVEVIMSSVRPLQLMMGKIIGIASVGLTQVLLWAVLTVTVVGGLLFFFQGSLDPAATADMPGQQVSPAETQQMAEQIQGAIDTINLPLIFGCVVFYFLGGYLLYSALFAAVGSAADTDTDAQQFAFPIGSPLLISILLLSPVVGEPDGPLAFWLSMIPFTSPVIMMVRIPFGVPTWELLLSMALLVAGFIFTTWIAAKVYRIGILTYGSKVSYKTLGKWLFS